MGVSTHPAPKPPPGKNAPKPPPRKKPEKNRFDWKSQGQIFQECQGQIPMSNRKKCAKTTTWKKPVLTGEKWKPPNGKSQGHIGKTGFNRKKAVLTGKSVTKNKKPKTLKEMSIY